MRKDVTTDLKLLFQVLRGKKFIEASNFAITKARLNPAERPGLRKHVPWIARGLYQRLAELGVSFDAVAGVPTGGEQYARALTNLIRGYDCRELPHIWLEKVEEGMRVEDMGGSPRGVRVVLVEDLVCSGLAIKQAVGALARINVEVVACLAVGELNYGICRGLSVPLSSLFNREFLEREHIYA